MSEFGFIARLFGRRLRFIEPILFPAQRKLSDGTVLSETPDAADKSAAFAPHSVIVIGRQYGSGGHDIGKALAEKLGFSFYDNEIIQMAAGSTGYTPQFIRDREENMTNSLLYDLVSQMYIYSEAREAPHDKIFEAESSVIREAAAKGDCVIVGRCADYILRDLPNCLKVYLHASEKFRTMRIMETEHLSEHDALQKIHQKDRRRADNYRYYTGRLWGHSRNYDLTVNTEIGADAVEAIITETLKASGTEPATPASAG